MSYLVSVAQFDEPFSVEMGQTILDAALALDLPYPHGCTAGNCGACKSELREGEVDMLPHSDYALSEAEAAAGKILACRAVPWSDCRVELLGDDELVAHPQRHLTTEIVAIERPTHDIVSIRLAVTAGGPMTFTAGQYASVEFDGVPARDFSMANIAEDETLEFHLRVVPNGAASGYAAERAAIGERVRVKGPFGGSYLRENHSGPVLLAGGGTGLAPMLSILDTLLARDPQRRVVLYVGARDERDLYAHERIARREAAHSSLTVHRVLSEPAASTAYRTGYLADAIAADHADLTDWKAYLAGPPIMVDTCTAALESRGLARRDIHADSFVPAVAEELPV